MTHRGPFQPLPFCDSVILSSSVILSKAGQNGRVLQSLGSQEAR